MSGVVLVAGQRYIIITILINIAWECLPLFVDQEKAIRPSEKSVTVQC